MILTKSKIFKEVCNKNICIEPFDDDMLNPNSYNYRLGRFLKETINSDEEKVKFKTIDLYDYPSGYLLEPGKFYLGTTFEVVGSKKYAMSLIGRSSIGRYGMFLQVSANLGHTGSCHCWTLEIVTAQKIRVYYKMVVGQVSFWNNFGRVEVSKHFYNTFNTPKESEMR